VFLWIRALLWLPSLVLYSSKNKNQNNSIILRYNFVLYILKESPNPNYSYLNRETLLYLKLVEFSLFLCLFQYKLTQQLK
jgi:hypothetical protein